MARPHPNLGQGKIGCVLWLLLLLAFVGVCLKVIPVKIHSAELYDFMEEQAMFAGRTSLETIKKRILDRAKDLEIPLTKKGLTVERRAGRIRIRAVYTVPVEFPGYTHHWEFEQTIDRPVFVV
jgi:hypothetical protein